MGYGLGLIYVLVIGFGVFISILSVVCMVKFLQLVEDVRYMRSKSDINVQRPKKYSDTIKICIGISLGVSGLLVTFLASAGYFARLVS